MLGKESYRRFRQRKLAIFTNQLKGIVGPLLNASTSRHDAGAELNSVVLVA